MEYYEALNKVIDEIEDNITEIIDYKKLAKTIGTSDYTMQRIFAFLTGITITEYIRKRRLSKAAEDLSMGNEKIIDIATKYQYDSPISFTRAFTKMHNVRPSDIRKKEQSLKTFPKFEFKPTDKSSNELEYKIENWDEQIFYGKSTGVIELEQKDKIQQLFDKCEQDRYFR